MLAGIGAELINELLAAGTITLSILLYRHLRTLYRLKIAEQKSLIWFFGLLLIEKSATSTLTAAIMTSISWMLRLVKSVKSRFSWQKMKFRCGHRIARKSRSFLLAQETRKYTLSIPTELTLNALLTIRKTTMPLIGRPIAVGLPS